MTTRFTPRFIVITTGHTFSRRFAVADTTTGFIVKAGMVSVSEARAFITQQEGK